MKVIPAPDKTSIEIPIEYIVFFHMSIFSFFGIAFLL